MKTVLNLDKNGPLLQFQYLSKHHGGVQYQHHGG